MEDIFFDEEFDNYLDKIDDLEEGCKGKPCNEDDDPDVEDDMEEGSLYIDFLDSL